MIKQLTWTVAAVGVVAFVAAAGASAAGAAGPVTVHDPRITEASGIARGIASPGVYYVQNDSGDSARFFAVDADTGRVRAVYHVPHATNHDWEDLAAAPNAAGVDSVWLADIGDNGAQRSQVEIYRVREPHVDMTRYNRSVATGSPAVWRLRYPGGAVDAESLAVTPSGRAIVITKAASGRSRVYAVPAHPAPNRVRAMRQIATITFRAPEPVIPAGLQREATGAAIAPDGRLLVVRTYTQAYLWTLSGDSIAAITKALRTAPRVLSLPMQPQGEGVTVVGNDLVLNSEGTGTALVSVPLPARFRLAPQGNPATRTPSPTTGTASGPASATPSPGQATGRTAAPEGLIRAYTLATLGGLVVLVALVSWVRRSRGGRRTLG